MKQNTSVEAYLDDYQLLTVEVSRRYYNGFCESFYVREKSGTIIHCKMKSNAIFDNFNRYQLELDEELIPGNEYDLVVNQGYRCSVAFRYIVQTSRFDEEYSYEGDDLGAVVHDGKTMFNLWAPTAVGVTLCIKEQKNQYYDMERSDKGVWRFSVEQDLEGTRYTYLVKVNGEVKESIDPYGKTSDANAQNSVVVNVAKLKEKKTDYVELKQPTDAILYELSVRDMTMAVNSGTKQHGTFSALIEKNTHLDGHKTGFDYLCQLGVTHVQLMPVNDFFTVDEHCPSAQYNWGYDPHQYMTLEGSYSSDPSNGLTRIHEFMEMVNAFHQANIGINLDVVFNHMYDVGLSSFEMCVPYYYFRVNANKSLSNGSFCGNDFESARKMSRKYIIDTCLWFVEVFGIDGFRFDLLGILDIDTVNEIEKKVHEINLSAMLYGEGWNLPTALAEDKKCMISNSSKVPAIAFFNDYYRDHLKGKTSEHEKNHRGYLTGDVELIEAAKFSIAGMAHPGYYHFFDRPTQSINYFECHDNATLWDKMKTCCNDEVREIRVKRQKLINAVLLFSQGIPFIHCGQEFCRSKNGYDNTYNKPDRINQVDWGRKNRGLDVVKHMQDCIQLRKSCAAFRLSTKEQLLKHVHFETADKVLIYQLRDIEELCQYKKICVLINPFKEDKMLKAEGYTCILDEKGLCSKKLTTLRVPGYSVLVIAK